MQIKIFRIPSVGNALLEDEMNAFLRSKKVVKVDCFLSPEPTGAAWCYSIQYIEDGRSGARGRVEVDWREKLSPEVFARFATLRELRNKLAQQEGVVPYAVFNNEELAGIAQIGKPTRAEMLKVKGVGEQKMEKYGATFLEELNKLLQKPTAQSPVNPPINPIFDAEEESEPPF